MEHANDIDLIELVAGRLDAGSAEAVERHLNGCEACRKRLCKVRATYDVLGAWDVTPLRRLDPGQVVALAQQQAPQRAAGPIRLFATHGVLRAAASVAVAALVGYVAGQWSIRPVVGFGTDDPPAYVSVLGLDFGESLSPLVFADEPSTGEEI